MRNATELRSDFELYFTEIDRCLAQECHWALLHVLLVLPDICSSLEDPQGKVGKRYTRWCRENMPSHPDVTPGDRYQMRNAVLHQGTTIPQNRAKDPDEQSNYDYFSFVDSKNFPDPIHQSVSTGTSGKMLNVNVTELASDTRQAMEAWFLRVERDATKNAAVVATLPTLARVKPKLVQIERLDPAGGVITFEYRGNTTSST